MSVHLGTGGQSWYVGRLFGIPIHFTLWYLLFAFVVLARAGFTVTGVLWLAVLTFGVLVHELGHGLMAVHYRLGAKITISAFGGWCEHAPAHRRRDDFHVVAAGPLAGLALALVSWLLYELTATVVPPIVSSVFWMSASANLFWSLFNALPVYSLDGGRMLHVGLGWWTSNRRADGITWWTGTFVGAGLALLGLSQGSLLITVLAGYLAYQNYQRAQHHDLRRTFLVDRNPPPASPGGLGLDISPTLWRLAGAIGALWLGGYLSGGYGGYLFGLALQPMRLLEGTALWSVLTYPWMFAPGDWAPMLLTVLALLVCGPPVEQRVGTTGLGSMLVLAGLTGALTATLLPMVAPWLARPNVLGGGAMAMALLVAGAGVAPLEAVGFGKVRFTARTVALAIVLLDVAAVVSGLTDWHLALHVGGLLVGLGTAFWARPQAKAAPPDFDFRQGAQQDETWH